MPTGRPLSFGERRHELVRPRSLEGPGRVVEEDARGAEVGKLLGLLEHLLRLAALPRAVDEARVELAVGRGDRLARLAQVLDVVQRVVQAEDVDAALRRARDEPAREITSDRTRADEKAAAQRHSERGLRPCLEGPNPLPGALDPAPYCAIEDPAAGHLERRKPGPVEELGELEEVGSRHAPGQRLLAEQANSRIDERRHAERVTLSLGHAGTRVATSPGPRSCKGGTPDPPRERA